MSQDLTKQMEDLKSRYVSLSIILEEIWIYHPSNPDFINPIKAYNNILVDLAKISIEINALEYKINSLN